MRKTNTLHVVSSVAGRLFCGVGLHYFCKHPATVVTHEGVRCTRCECEMEYVRAIRAFVPVSPIQPCLRQCGKVRSQPSVVSYRKND